MSNSLDPDQARHFVGPDLGPNCLQRLSADDTCRRSSFMRYPADNACMISDLYYSDRKLHCSTREVQ